MGRLISAILLCCLVADAVSLPGLGLVRPGLNEIEISVQQKLKKFLPDPEAKNRVAKQTPREKRSTDDVIDMHDEVLTDEDESPAERSKRTLELDPALLAKSQGPDEIIDPFDLEQYLQAQPDLHKVFSPSNPATITVTEKAAPPCGAEHEPKVKQPILVIPRPVIVEHYEQPILLVHRTLPVVNDIYDEPTLVEKEIQQVVVEQVPAPDAHLVAKRSTLYPYSDVTVQSCGCPTCRRNSEPAFYPYDEPLPCDCGCPNCQGSNPYEVTDCGCGCPNCAGNPETSSPCASQVDCGCGCPNCQGGSPSSYSPYESTTDCGCGCPNCGGDQSLNPVYSQSLNPVFSQSLNPVFSRYEYSPEEYSLPWKRDTPDEPEFLTVVDPANLNWRWGSPHGGAYSGDNVLLGDLHDYAHFYPGFMSTVLPATTSKFQYFETGRTTSDFGVPVTTPTVGWSSSLRPSSSWPAPPHVPRPSPKFVKEKIEKTPLVSGEPCLPQEDPSIEDLREYATDGSEIDAEPEKRASKPRGKTQTAQVESTIPISSSELVSDDMSRSLEDSMVSASAEESDEIAQELVCENSIPTMIPSSPILPSVQSAPLFTPSYPGYYPSMDYPIYEPVRSTRIIFQPYAQRITHPPVYWGQRAQTTVPQVNFQNSAPCHAEPEDEIALSEDLVDSMQLQADSGTFEGAKSSLVEDIVQEVLKQSPIESSESVTQAPEVKPVEPMDPVKPVEEVPVPVESTKPMDSKKAKKNGKGRKIGHDLSGEKMDSKEARLLENEIFNSDSTVELRRKRQSRPKHQPKVSKISEV
ncbi:unnamed protein product [Bemisia tabaci]|uniref:Post-SET domain-containing protein n=1 Tax=Bemisia tabaci TaxID=7038 RepID=A0A9P0G5H4_BEMTA|nr:unnamed protein product [Bemisia tabaci]